ncbi:MAG TPA: divalent metal cation transporter [Candidatus Limnocylindrales bacterium]|nr:divalent metal cation transporter [Candidatus Limnocylindrales bacterium]
MKRFAPILLGILTSTGGFLDAGSITTSAAAGSRFGFGLVWALVIGTIAVMLLVEMSGRLSAVSGKAYAEAIRERFGFRFYLLPLTADVLSNGLLLGAELGGIAVGLSLITGIAWHLMVPVAVVLVFVLLWRGPFGLIEQAPSLLGLVTLSFVIAVPFAWNPGPGLVETLWHPAVASDRTVEYLFLAAAILGATVSPYLVYFYSSGGREEHWTDRSLGANRVTAVVGLGFGSVSALGLMLLAALVLRPRGIQGQTLSELGIGLAVPFGQVGGLLFGLALFATCLGAALEVALAVAYDVSQGFGWQWGQEHLPVHAARFNTVLIAYVAIGTVGLLLAGDPLSLALVASAILALILPFALAPFLVLMNDADYVQDRQNGLLANAATVGVLAVAFIVAVASLPLLLLSGGG